MRKIFIWILTVVTASAAPAAAAEFYAGKTLHIVVGFGPGGGYDSYARALARRMGRFLPGNPAIVVQNMPGAGSLKAVNYLYNVAPRDGTVIATFARGIVFEPLMGHAEGAQFDGARFNWIGSVSNEVGVCAFMTSSGIRSFADQRARPHLIGASGAGADSDIFPIVLRNLFHLPTKLVSGYQGGADMVLAMQRHEIDGRCGWSWTSLVSRDKAMLDAKDITVTLQIALGKHEDLPDVPLVTEIATDPRHAAALRLLVSRQTIARPFAAPPGVPQRQVEELRAAFEAVMRDPDFLAEAHRQSLEVRPLGGAEVQTLLGELLASPPDVVKAAADLVREQP